MSESRTSPFRTRLLVSVRDAAEARIAHEAGADIVDGKDPQRGALGALPVSAIGAIVTHLGAGATTSAVAGAAENGDTRLDEIAAVAATGVDYVKLAVTPALTELVLAAMAATVPGRLVGVLFAEDGIEAQAPGRLAAAGFAGAMIDTRGKTGRRLGDLVQPEALARFVVSCRDHGLLSGLAGSLRVEDISAMAGHAPDYLGFRGGLCVGGGRRNALEAARIRAAAAALRALKQRDAA